MKLFIAAATVAIAASAHASFELMLMFDDSIDAVRRYDPVNRVSLGSFAEGMLGLSANANQMELDPTRPGTVSLMDVSGHVRTFDYSSGLIVGSVNTGSSPLNNIAPSTLKFTNTGNIIRVANTSTAPQVFNPLTGALISTFTTFSTYSTIDVAPLADGRFVTLERQLVAGNYEFSLFLRSSSGGLVSSKLDYISSTNPLLQNKITLDGGKIFISGSATFPEIVETSITGSSFSATLDIPGASNVSLGFSNVAFGHQGRGYFTARNSSTAITMYHMDANAGFYSTQYNLPFSGSVTSIAVVNAPEPATLTFFGIGAVWLAKRRKGRTK